MKSQNSSTKLRRSKNTSPYLFITPSLIMLTAVVLLPLLYALYLSFFNTHGLVSEFTGLKNYINMLQGKFFWDSTIRTIYFTVVSVFLEFVLGMLSALLLNKKFAWRGLARTVLILPWALPTVVNGVLWSWIFNSSYGSFNGLLYSLGLIKNYVPWFGDPLTAMNCVIAADVWKNFSMIALILLAGLQTIPGSYLESAKIDGANAVQSFFKITLPILKPSILVCLILRTMEAFKVFDIVYTMTKGGPANGTQVISYYAYQISFQYTKFGEGAALSFLISLIIFMMAIVYIRLLNTKEKS